MRALLVVVAAACLVACSSDESSGTGGAGSGGVGAGGAGGTAVSGGAGGCPGECFAASECVHACGETPVNYGCCGCPPGMIDVHQCATDAGCHPALADAGTLTCGASTCNATQVCVHPCCGGASIDGSACKPAPPFCAEANTLSCTPCDGNNCSAPGGSCSGLLVGQELNCQCA